MRGRELERAILASTPSNSSDRTQPPPPLQREEEEAEWPPRRRLLPPHSPDSQSRGGSSRRRAGLVLHLLRVSALYRCQCKLSRLCGCMRLAATRPCTSGSYSPPPSLILPTLQHTHPPRACLTAIQTRHPLPRQASTLIHPTLDPGCSPARSLDPTPLLSRSALHAAAAQSSALARLGRGGPFPPPPQPPRVGSPPPSPMPTRHPAALAYRYGCLRCAR